MRTRKLITSLDLLIKNALTSFVRDLSDDPWERRERELINLFVFGHLAPNCRRGETLHQMTQIGIEAAVPQLKGRGGLRKRPDVCKDVVIWPEPKMTCWGNEGEPLHYPLSVMEWTSFNTHERGRSLSKRKRDKYAEDRKWLLRMSLRMSQLKLPFVGYRVFVNQKDTRTKISVDRAYKGQTTRDWWLQ